MLSPGVHPIPLPLRPVTASGWVQHSLVSGSTAGLHHLACDVVTVAPGRSRHPVHAQDEEQIVLILEGVLQVAGLTLARGAFVFLPPRMPHTVTNVGQELATYLAVSWSDGGRAEATKLAFTRFDTAGQGPLGEKVHPWGVRQRHCDAATGHLAALRSHLSLMAPGGSYAPHADPYDVVIVTLDGTVETLDCTVLPDRLIVYPSGSTHGMRNPGATPARYVVFELHSRRMADHLPRPPLLARLSDPRRWKRKLGLLGVGRKLS